MGWWTHLPNDAKHRGMRAFARSVTVALLQVGSLAASVDANALTAQTISFAAPSSKTFGVAPFAISATASSGLAVSFSSQTATTCSVAGATVTILAAGTCTIQASQAGNASYAAAPTVNQSFTVAKAVQTIIFAALPGKTYGAAPFAVSASASSGLPVSFVSTTTAVCTVSGATVTIVAGGTCTIQARQGGNGNFNAATSVNQGFAVAKAVQSITFAALAGKTYGNPPFGVSATASSGLAVTFISTTTTICTISANTVTIKSAGTCTIQAAQAGNTSYVAATAVSQSFAVAKAAQTITFGALADRAYGTAPFTVSATASSGLAVGYASLTATVCTASGNTITIRSAGACSIQATQSGSANFNAAISVSQTFTVTPGAQTISFPAPGNQLLGNSPLVLAATASSGLAVSYSSLTPAICAVGGSAASLLSAGTCTVQAAQAGNDSYSAAAPVIQTFVVIEVPQFSGTAYTTGSYPQGIAVADFNGDGKRDVAVANAFSGSVSILLGDGAGRLSTGTAVQLGGQPVAVVAGDFNGDSRIDLAVADFYYNRVFLLSGNGNGTFAVGTPISAGLAPIALASSDLNRDGKLDLIVVNGSSGNTIGQSVTVLLGNGNGSFGVPLSYPTGPSPYAVVVADFNGDGNPDLAVANGDGNSVSVLLGRGDGTFAPAVNYAAGSYPDGIAAGDLNGDGKIDLAIANDYSNDVSILLGRGDGTFGPASRFTAGNGPASIVIADFNGDGRNDLAIANRFDDTVALLVGNGDGTFQPALAYAVGAHPAAVTAIDLDRDGRIDLLVSDAADNDVAVLLQWAAPTVTTTLQSGSPQSVALNGAYAPLVVLISDGGGRPLQGAAVTFVAPPTGASGTFVGGTATAQVSTDAFGLATAPTFTANGTSGSFTVIANAGSGASVTFSLTNAGGASQSISFATLPGKVYGAAPFAVSASASSGLPVGFASLTVATCTVSGTTVSLVAVGTCTIRASQPGNASYTAASSVDQSFAIAQATQTITFGAIASQTFGSGVFNLSATTTSGLTVSLSSLTPMTCALGGNTVALVAAGTCTIRAGQAGNSSFGPASNVDRTFMIAQGGQTIDFSALANLPLDARPKVLQASASSGLPVSFASRTPTVCSVEADLVSMIVAGTCTIRASQGGNADYLPAPVIDRSFAITRANQSVAFANPSAHAVSATPFALSASASSGLSITFASLTAANCSVNGAMATAIGAGTCTIRASQTGNANYSPAWADESFPIVSGLLSSPSATPAGPLLTYATYLGGYGADKAFDVIATPDGAAYVGGSVASSNFPGLNSSAFTNSGLDLLFITRVNPSGGKLDFSTVTGGRANDISGTGGWTYVGMTQPELAAFIGGGQVEAIATDGKGNVYAASYANSTDYPVRGGTYMRGGAKYIFKVGPTGAVQVASGAIDPAVMTIRALAVDSAGAIYLTGVAGQGLATTAGALLATMPTPTGAYVTASAPYLIKLAPGGTATAFSTYLSIPGRRSGSPDLYDQSLVDAATTAYAVAVDASGNSYVAGQATSDEFPATPGAPDTADTKHRDAFVAKVNSTGTAMLFTARLGGADAERATGVALSPDGSIVIGGKTATQPFWGTGNAFQSVVEFRPGTPYLERETGFVAKLSADGKQWLFVAALGADGGNLVNGAVNSADISPIKVAVDAGGAIYAAGTTSPYRDLVQHIDGSAVPNALGGIDTSGAFVVKISSDAAQLLYLAALGGLGSATGLALDNVGNAYVSGYGSLTATVDATLAAPMYEGDYSSAFVAKLNDQYAPVILSTGRNPAIAGQTLILTATVADARDSGTVEFDDASEVLGIVPVSEGRATLPVSLSVGVHRLRATYRGAGVFDGHSALEVVQSVDQAPAP